jgi:hypothetical protein
LRFKSGMQTSSSPQFLKMIMVSFLDGGEFKSRTGVRMERGSRGSCCRYAGAKSASSRIQYFASTTRLVNLSRMSLCRIIFCTTVSHHRVGRTHPDVHIYGISTLDFHPSIQSNCCILPVLILIVDKSHSRVYQLLRVQDVLDSQI